MQNGNGDVFLGYDFQAGIQDRLEARGVHISMRGDTMRVSPHLWVNQADVDRLLAALAEVAPAR